MTTAANNADNFYGVKQTLKIKDVLHNNDRYPDRADNTKTWYKHTVIFDCEGLDYRGTFYQKESPQLIFNNKVIQAGETLCFKPDKYIDPLYGDKVSFCYETSDKSTTEELHQPKIDHRLTRSVSFSYAERITIAFFADKKEVTLDHIVNETIRISKDIEKHLLDIAQ